MFTVEKLTIIPTETDNEASCLRECLHRDKNDPRLAMITNSYILTDNNNTGVVLEGMWFDNQAVRTRINAYLREVKDEVEQAADLLV